MFFPGEKQALEKRRGVSSGTCWWEKGLTHNHLDRGAWSPGEGSELERKAWGTWSIDEHPRVGGFSFRRC